MTPTLTPPPALVSDIRSGDLPPTRTHAGRGWHFVPAADPTAVQAGTLTVTQGKREATTYLVGVTDDEPAVYFAKQDGGFDVYAVPFRTGRPVECSCPGYRFQRTCKHKDAAVALVAAGLVAVPGGS